MDILCPFCGAPYTEAMLRAMDGSYGCDTGCEFMRVIIACESCKRAVYVWGTFGETDHSLDEHWRRETFTGKDLQTSLANAELYEEDDPEFPSGTW